MPAGFLLRAAYVGSQSLHILETQYYTLALRATPQSQEIATARQTSAGKPRGLRGHRGHCGILPRNPNTSGALFKPNTFSTTVQAD